jgi:hypothetical protein
MGAAITSTDAHNTRPRHGIADLTRILPIQSERSMEAGNKMAGLFGRAIPPSDLR